MPAEVQCLYDQDGNGLDDDVEQEIAECAVPTFRFDSEENALRSDEPVMLYNMYMSPGDPTRVRVQFAMLFERDGGYYDVDGCPWNDHNGDNQPITVWVGVSPNGTSWNGAVQETNLGAPIEFNGTHPIVYLSAGKHHESLSPYDHSEFCAPPWQGTRRDRANGAGDQRTPSVFHAPLYHKWGESSNDSYSPPWYVVGASDGFFRNACLAAKFPNNTSEWQIADNLVNNWLDDFGYPGEQIGNNTKFCGGHDEDCGGGKIWQNLSMDEIAARDADGDGLGEMSFWFEGALTSSFASDPCPALDQTLYSCGPLGCDADGDGIHDACDPDRHFRQIYVAGGSTVSTNFPAVEKNPIGVGDWYAYAGAGDWTARTRVGYLDSDGDRLPDGEDRCEDRKLTQLTSTNRYGEDRNWPAGQNGNNRLGLFQRADHCDPYPVLSPSWGPPKSSSNKSKCNLSGVIHWGEASTTISQGLALGKSTNDVSALSNESFQAQTYRCACRGGFDCTEAVDASCHRHDLLPADPNALAGHGYRPVDRADCTRDAFSYCTEYTVGMQPNSGAADQSIEWDWEAEYSQFGPGSATPHYATDDITSYPHTAQHSAHLGANYSYVAWTQVAISSHRGFPQQPGSSLPDPEYDPRGAPLLNVMSAESRRMRAGFETTKGGLSATLHTEFVTPVWCPAGYMDKVMKHMWGVNPAAIHPFHPGVRSLGFTGRSFADLRLLRPVDETYASILAHETMGAAWVTSVDGVAALLAPQVMGLGEPDVLWIERGVTPARWARLTADGAGTTETRYRVIAHGELDVTVPDQAAIVLDLFGRNVAIADEATGRAALYNGASGKWTTTERYSHVLLRRSAPGLTLIGSQLFVTSGDFAGTFATDGYVIDLLGRHSFKFATTLPARRDATLALLPERGELLILGGVDRSGVAHDDLWRVPVGVGDTVVSPELLFTDTRTPDALLSGQTIVMALEGSGELQTWHIDNNLDTKLRGRRRTGAGWLDTNAAGAVIP